MLQMCFSTTLKELKWWLTVSHALDEIFESFNHFGWLLREEKKNGIIICNQVLEAGI